VRSNQRTEEKQAIFEQNEKYHVPTSKNPRFLKQKKKKILLLSVLNALGMCKKKKQKRREKYMFLAV